MPEYPENVSPMRVKKLLHPETGQLYEMLEEAPVRGRRKKVKRKMFAMLDLELIERLELRASEWDLLHSVMARVNPETNLAGISLRELAEARQLQRSAVARGLRELVDRRVIIRVRQGVYRVNSWIAFRGSAEDWHDACQDERQPIWRKP